MVITEYYLILIQPQLCGLLHKWNWGIYLSYSIIPWTCSNATSRSWLPGEQKHASLRKVKTSGTCQPVRHGTLVLECPIGTATAVVGLVSVTILCT